MRKQAHKKNNLNLPKVIQVVNAEPVFEPLMLLWTLLRGLDQKNKHNRNVTNIEREVWSNFLIVSGKVCKIQCALDNTDLLAMLVSLYSSFYVAFVSFPLGSFSSLKYSN